MTPKRKDNDQDLAMCTALKALQTCYKVFRMDDVDTSISMQTGMAISLLKKVLGEKI